jgi:hypothetical protein
LASTTKTIDARRCFLPVPDFIAAAKSQAGQRLLELENALRKREIDTQHWDALDEAVFDLYGLK